MLSVDRKLKRLYSFPFRLLIVAFAGALIGAQYAKTDSDRLGAVGLVLTAFSALAATPVFLHPWDAEERAARYSSRQDRLLKATFERRLRRNKRMGRRAVALKIKFDDCARPLAIALLIAAVALAIFGHTRTSISRSLVACGLVAVAFLLFALSYAFEALALYARNQVLYGPKQDEVTFFGLVEFAEWLRSSTIARWIAAVCFFVGAFMAYLGFVI